MNSNDPRDEAILALVGAVQHLSIDAKSRELTERAEAFVRGARLVEQFVAAREEITAEIARLEGLRDAHEWIKKHMPTKVSNFGGSDGMFGWTGIDAAGNRVTWKVEPPAAADEGSLPAAVLEKEMLRRRSAGTMHALHQVLINTIEKCGADEETSAQAARAFRAGLAAFEGANPVPQSQQSTPSA